MIFYGRAMHLLSFAIFFCFTVTRTVSDVQYTAHNSFRRWSDAKQACASSSFLAKIQNLDGLKNARKKFIQYQTPPEYWIGVKYLASSDSFVWANGDGVPTSGAFEAIVDRVEVTSLGSNQCMYITESVDILKPADCAGHKKYICQTGEEDAVLPTSSAPSPTSSTQLTSPTSSALLTSPNSSASSLWSTSSAAPLPLSTSLAPVTSPTSSGPLTSPTSSASSPLSTSLASLTLQTASKSPELSSSPLTSPPLQPASSTSSPSTFESSSALISTSILMNASIVTESTNPSQYKPSRSTPTSSPTSSSVISPFERLIKDHEDKLHELNVSEVSSLENAVNLTSQLFKDVSELDISGATTNILVSGEELEKFAIRYATYHMTSSNDSETVVSIEQDEIAMTAMRIPANNSNDVVFPRNTASLDETFVQEEKEAVRLPAKLFSAQERYAACILYNNAAKLVPAEETGKRRIASKSRIVACTLFPRLNGVLTENVTIKLSRRQREETEVMPNCVYWNFSPRTRHGGSWSRVGCSLVQSSQKETTCTCNHLTNFAVLMEVGQTKISDGNKLALEIITYIGCALSLSGECVTILVYLVLMNLRSSQTQIRLNMVVCLAIAQLVFMTGIEATQKKVLCISVAITINYFYLVAFAWMVAEGVMLYLKVVRVFNVTTDMKYFYGLAWGVPTLVVVIAVSTSVILTGGMESSMRRDVCWFSFSSGFIWCFVGPVLLACLTNLVILVRVVVEMVKLKDASGSSETHTVRQSVKACAVLFPLLGLAWIFGVLVVTDAGLIFQYLFTILNSLQGFFIFIFHVARSKEVQASLLSKKHRWDASRGISVSNEKRTVAIGLTRSEKDKTHLKPFSSRNRITPSSTMEHSTLPSIG